MITTSYLDRLDNFIKSLKDDVYPEPIANEDFINSGINSIRDKINEGQEILDVGCGHGYALNKFKMIGACPIGITLDEEDKKKAENEGNEVHIMDMSDLQFEDNKFDGIWARHSLEHSVFPYFTLHEFYRVLKPQGWIYVEVPAPDTDCLHETNGNHYSVMGLSMWCNLMQRVGFKEISPYNMNFELAPPYQGKELYFRIIGVKND